MPWSSAGWAASPTIAVPCRARAEPRLLAVKIAIAGVGIAIVFLEVDAEIGGLALAVAWAVLIAAEVVIRPSSTGAPSGLFDAEPAAAADI